MKEIFCLDTHILIWGILEQSKNSQQEKIKKTKVFLQQLSEKGIWPLVPMPVLSEVLIKVPHKGCQKLINLFQKRFLLAEYDAMCALYHNQIVNDVLRNRPLKQAADEFGITREIMKFDLMILATALRHKARCLITEDEKLENIAKSFIEVKHIEPDPYQGELFEEEEKNN